MLVISSEDVRELVDIDDVIELVEESYLQHGTDQINDVPRENIDSPVSEGELKVLAAAGPPGFGTYYYTGGWDPREEDVLWNVVSLFDNQQGELLCIIENNRLSWLRTGATSGVATKHCAPPEASTLGIIGSGKQAKSQLLAVSSVRELSDVRVFSPTRAHREEFAETMGGVTEPTVRSVDSAQAAVAGSDIVCTATTSSTPVIEGEWLDPATHINSIGTHYPEQREVDTRTIERSRVIVDSLARARKEEGELLIPAEENRFDWSSTLELGEIVAGKAEGRETRDQITFMTSGAIAAEILVPAREVYERAKDRGLGKPMDFDLPSDLVS